MTDVPYSDEDLVYVDPAKRLVIGKVEFAKNGNAKTLLMPEAPPEEAKEGRRPRIPRKRYYPWGTYRSMRKLYKIDGGITQEDRQISLDEAMEKSSKEPFWN